MNQLPHVTRKQHQAHNTLMAAAQSATQDLAKTVDIVGNTLCMAS